jgi:flagellar motor switch/type III secretory pathway protein FliN
MSQRRAGRPSKNTEKSLSPQPTLAPPPAASATRPPADRSSAIEIPAEPNSLPPLALVDWQTFQEPVEPALAPQDGSQDAPLEPPQADSTVSMRIPVGSISLSPAQWKQLRPGTILTLDQRIDAPVVIWIDHLPSAYGTLLQRDGSCTVRIEEPLSATRPNDTPSSHAGRPATRKAA